MVVYKIEYYLHKHKTERESETDKERKKDIYI